MEPVTSCSGPSDLVARLGGDEVAVLVRGAECPERVGRRLATRSSGPADPAAAGACKDRGGLVPRAYSIS